MPLIHILGYAGLVPFIGLTCLQLWPQLMTFPASFTAFQSYSQIILAFMAGVLWPVLYQHSGKLFPLWVVSFALAGWFSSLLLPKQQLLVLAAAFIALRLFEYTQSSQLDYSPAYNRLRNHLTTVVVLCHLLYWLSLTG
ncbi:DUF3429 domain-containing protein [Rheinheimera mesophila]|uniref:DUF3429 domain-containing protein n=1 Tax=Rheinheimera mesophila TaxID=1547515 RepID=A0A3P3QJH5_9GAMM|nr:DUF3429 domain-containing protein [Rheinheimera mesophila]KKL01342.1 hypothetical protein SD53_10640 [Rheinheimera mesophila]RRJ21228.1 DUF3429 domain-containing protein [Rheinheimera mesophila]